ncbi:hypothetical protein ABZP36_031700 [Zizania latifolia]
MTELFDTAMTSLLHLPEVLDRLAAGGGDRRSAGDHGRTRINGIGGGGGAPVDIVETPGEYAFVLDVPGLSKSDIQVTLEEDRVLVMTSSNGAGKRKREEEEEGECRYIRLERRGAVQRSFVRKFRLPEDADTGGISARCENGVLTVTVKKRPPPEKKTKSVHVTVA